MTTYKCKRGRYRILYRRKRWNTLINNPFHKSEKIDWHHINDVYLVAVPRDIHRLYQNDVGDDPYDHKNIHRYGNRIYW